VSAQRGTQLVGYWQDWVNVKWWDNNIPGNCLMGCAVPQPFFQRTTSFNSINHGFAFLTENPNPDQVNCSAAASCPIWDGRAIFMARASMQGSEIVTDSTTVSSYTPGLVTIGEVCRLSRQHPDGPKRCLISFGGWSDWSRIGSPDNGKRLAALLAKMVELTFADGIDFDFEHMEEYTRLYGVDEYANYASMVAELSVQLVAVSQNRVATANARIAQLQKEYDALEQWQKPNAHYFPTNIQYLRELISNPLSVLEMSYTTRFNAFIDPSAPLNYLDPGSPVPPPFLTDNEGAKVFNNTAVHFDTVNIMAYDACSSAGPLKLNFEQILKNFETLGKFPKSKLNIGFEPGEQACGAVWEGQERDEAAAKFVSREGYGGTMIWAINPDPAVHPKAATNVPLVRDSMKTITKPSWPFGAAPTYTKADPVTGWTAL